jgi:two-component system, cell cycle sensor histidine kinase and response regulator CckA
MAHRISLIVDDEPAIRNYIRTILERECFDTVEAGTGKRGLEILEDLGAAVDLIVSDVHMPGGDGLTFARKAAQSFPGVPIILVSGYVSGHEAEPFEFLEKPFSPDSLLRAVRKVVPACAA